MHQSKRERKSPDFTSRAYWNGTIKMSLSKFFILRALYREPLHGYQIARTVARMTNGCCSPTEGTIYPVLREFESGGYVTVEEQHDGARRRKVYTLTERGRQAFRVAVDAWMDVTRCLIDAERALDNDRNSDGTKGGDCC